MTKRRWVYALGGLILLFLILQLVPAEPAANPPLEEELAAPAPVAQLLERACYDCHSFATEWPWYAHVAPTKWLVRDHVAEGRSSLNFTAWNRLSADDRPHKLEEVAEEVEEEHMPLRSYLILHPEARLTAADRETLVEWAMAAAEAAEAAEDRDGADPPEVDDDDAEPGT